MDNTTTSSGSTAQLTIALILSIFSTISGIILHYKLKHFKVCCLESDCVTSPPSTPAVSSSSILEEKEEEDKIDLKEAERLIAQKFEEHFKEIKKKETEL